MKDLMSTTALIASIAVVVALMFMAPKGFALGDPSPIVTSDAAVSMVD